VRIVVVVCERFFLVGMFKLVGGLCKLCSLMLCLCVSVVSLSLFEMNLCRLFLMLRLVVIEFFNRLCYVGGNWLFCVVMLMSVVVGLNGSVLCIDVMIGRLLLVLFVCVELRIVIMLFGW